MSRKVIDHVIDVDHNERFLIREDKFQELKDWLDKNCEGENNIAVEDEELLIDIEPAESMTSKLTEGTSKKGGHNSPPSTQKPVGGPPALKSKKSKK